MPDYTAFAASPLWDMQRRYFERHGMDAWATGQVPHYVTSHPAMARAYAQVVLGFWRDLKARGMAGAGPLYIIELGAGPGRFAYHFLLHFFAAFDAVRDPHDEVCYVMTDCCAVTVDAWRQRLHARLDPFVAQGRLDFAVFDADTDDALDLQARRIRLSPGSLALPPVVIANYVFGSMRQDLFFLDKERLYEGWVAVATDPGAGDDAPFAGLTLAYQKRRTTAPAYANGGWNRIVERYAADLPPCALLFPAPALDALERLGRLHTGQLLLLAADRGSHERAALAGQQEPDFARHGSVSLPVNFHGIAQVVEAQGGRCWTNPAGDGLAILAARWRAAPDEWRETALAARQALDAGNPNDVYRVKQVLETEAQYLSPEQMLAFLRLCFWDTKVFYLMYAYLYDLLAQLPEAARRQWHEALGEIWRFHLPIGEDYDLAFDLAMLASELERWAAAIAWFRQSLDGGGAARGDERSLRNVHVNLGICHAQVAAYDEAERCLLQALAEPEDEEQPDAADIAERLDDVRTWRARCEQVLRAHVLRPDGVAADQADAVYATLLAPHHAQALYRLQRDPDLCRRAGVECLDSTDHARAWIEREQTAHKHVLALLHPHVGLVGVAALECPPGALDAGGSPSARFYYWIGRDFQNRGYGPQGLALLHQLAGRIGIAHLFSMVDDANTASRRALAKRGYRRLPFEPAGESPGCRYHHAGRAASDADVHAVLDRLLCELGRPAGLTPLRAHEAV